MKPAIGSVGTLEQLQAQIGDVVEGVTSPGIHTLGDPSGTGFSYVDENLDSLGTQPRFKLISRANPDQSEPKQWQHMTPEEKGALLLAEHEGKVIEYFNGKHWHVMPPHSYWYTYQAYRIKPEPVRETVPLYGVVTDDGDVMFRKDVKPHKIGATLVITYEVEDGEPDCASVKMEKIK